MICSPLTNYNILLNSANNCYILHSINCHHVFIHVESYHNSLVKPVPHILSPSNACLSPVPLCTTLLHTSKACQRVGDKSWMKLAAARLLWTWLCATTSLKAYKHREISLTTLCVTHKFYLVTEDMYSALVVIGQKGLNYLGKCIDSYQITTSLFLILLFLKQQW